MACLPKHAECSQVLPAAHPALLRALTAACQNDYNCKAVARQGAAGLAAALLSDSSSDTVFAAVCFMYTLTTQAEARLAVGQALAKVAGAELACPVGQLICLLAVANAGQCLQVFPLTQTLHLSRTHSDSQVARSVPLLKALSRGNALLQSGSERALLNDRVTSDQPFRCLHYLASLETNVAWLAPFSSCC